MKNTFGSRERTVDSGTARREMLPGSQSARFTSVRLTVREQLENAANRAISLNTIGHRRTVLEIGGAFLKQKWPDEEV